MTKAGKRLIAAAKEAVAIARGELEPAAVHHYPKVTERDPEATADKIVSEAMDHWLNYSASDNMIPTPMALMSKDIASALRAERNAALEEAFVALVKIADDHETKSAQHSDDEAWSDCEYEEMLAGIWQEAAETIRRLKSEEKG